MGKPGSTLRAIFIGTLAPANSGWWHDLVGAGSNRTTYVQVLKGDPEKWDKWGEIRRCNPLNGNQCSTFRKRSCLKSGTRREKIPGSKGRYLSYRLNVP